VKRKDRPGMALQIHKARTEFLHYLARWEFEVRNRAKLGHLENVGKACELLLEKLVRIQGHETLETRGFEMQCTTLAIRSKRLWEPGPTPRSVSKARPRLTLVQG